MLQKAQQKEFVYSMTILPWNANPLQVRAIFY